MSISGSARLAGVMGWPIAHSRSPRIHGYWLQEYGIDGAYVPLTIQPEDLADSFRMLPRLGFRGWNITLPHKEAALRLVNTVTAAAERIGAVNTVTVQPDGSLSGDNSDAFGFTAHLNQSAPGWPSDRPAVVLGAGGAARAVCFALLEAGVPEVRIANRTQARAESLATANGEQARAVPWEKRAAAFAYGVDGFTRRCRGERHCLCAIADTFVGHRRRARPAHGRWPWHVAAPGAAGLFPVVRAGAYGDRGALFHYREGYRAVRRSVFIIGLTGSIGMGKSTASAMLEDMGLPIFDADAAVHALMAKGGAAVVAVEEAFPGVVTDDAVSRPELGKRVFGDTAALRRLERILHPRVGEAERAFLARVARRRLGYAVRDVLLFETGGDKRCDATIVISAPAHIQRARVMARPGMTEDRLNQILAKQMPDAQKRQRADYVVPSGLGRRVTRDTLAAVMRDIRSRKGEGLRDHA